MTAMRVLVVEDNVLNMRLVRDVLQLAGHQVVEATNVDEGQARLAELVPDGVLLDIAIPGGGGPALLAWIRANQQLAQLPVIAVTAFAMRGDEERLLAMGFDGYISKPIEIGSFAQRVEAMIHAKRGG